MNKDIELLSAYLDGELSPEEVRLLEEKLSYTPELRDKLVELKRVKKAVSRAHDIGLLVNAGHGLNYTNVKKIAAIKAIRGLYIGHSIVAMSVYAGMQKAVKEMKELIEKSSK